VREVSDCEVIEVRGAGDVDHQILPRLITGNTVHIDDEEGVAAQIAVIGIKQDRIMGAQLTLMACPYFREVVDSFESEIRYVRPLRLTPS
jgi:hypothetical protein